MTATIALAAAAYLLGAVPFGFLLVWAVRREDIRKRGSGNFAQTVFEVAKTHRPVSGVSRASVGDVNAALDALAAARSKAEQIPVMARLVEATDATQLKWLAAIIIKDLKLGYGETAILRHFHPDANDLYNVCCDLRRVCDNLRSRARRFKRRDLEPGSLVKAMMASRVHSCAAAFDAMRNKRFVIESKFDGERIQVHREGPDAFRYFTRNNNDFGPRGEGRAILPHGLAAFLDYNPVGPAPLYRRVRWGKHVELFLLDTRSHRAPNLSPDTPDKSMLGADQRRWLERALLDSDATNKIVVTSVPLSIPTGSAWVAGRRAER